MAKNREKQAKTAGKGPFWAQNRPKSPKIHDFSDFWACAAPAGRGLMRRSNFPEQFRMGTPVRRRFSGLSAADLEKRTPGAVNPLERQWLRKRRNLPSKWTPSAPR
jgi:hypothetical protein